MAGCSPAQACPVFVTVTASVTLYVHYHVGSGLWPRSPSRTLWLGWHRQTPIFHSEWNIVLFSVLPLTDTIIKKAHIIKKCELINLTKGVGFCPTCHLSPVGTFSVEDNVL